MVNTKRNQQTKRPFDQRKCGQLLAQTLPAAIHSDAEGERTIAEIDKLLRKGVGNLSPEEEQLLELLSLLVERYEDETIIFHCRRHRAPFNF